MFDVDAPVTVQSLEAVEEVIATVPELTEDSVVYRCVHVLTCICKVILTCTSSPVVWQACKTLAIILGLTLSLVLTFSLMG